MSLRVFKKIRMGAKILFVCLGAFIMSETVEAAAGCHGKFVNPITDVCWKCLFPIRIAGVEVVGSDEPDTPVATRSPLYMCPGKLYPGLPIAFWEPARLVDVTKSPMCMVSLGGISLGTSAQKGFRDDKGGTGFYHVHWYIYPVLFWLELLTNFACMEDMPIDVAYLSEFDPFWGDDTKNTILNPEAFLFGNIIAHGACLADCAAASTRMPIDKLFWCAGCLGGVYPITGTVGHQISGRNQSLLVMQRMMFKLHRQFLLKGYMGKKGLCGKYSMPMMQKTQYRYQMTFPVAERSSCKRLGQTEVTWQAGREFPIKGEDFGYLIWRKRDCVLF